MRLRFVTVEFWVVSEWRRRSSASTAMSKGLKVAFDRDDTASGISSCSSTEMTEIPEANVSLQALSALT